MRWRQGMNFVKEQKGANNDPESEICWQMKIEEMNIVECRHRASLITTALIQYVNFSAYNHWVRTGIWKRCSTLSLKAMLDDVETSTSLMHRWLLTILKLNRFSAFSQALTLPHECVRKKCSSNHKPNDKPLLNYLRNRWNYKFFLAFLLSMNFYSLLSDGSDPDPDTLYD